MKPLWIVAVLLTPSVFAANALLTINETVTIDFTGERALTLLFPNGATRQFNWLSNETHSDVVFDHLLYYPFNEADYCNNTARTAETYQNMSRSLDGLVGICGSIIQHLNTTLNLTENCTNEALASKRDRDEYLRLWKMAESKFAVAENATAMAKTDCDTVRTDRDTFKGQADTYRSQADACTLKLSSEQRTTVQTSNTDTALKDCEDSKTISMLVAAAIAGLLGVYIGRKTAGGGGVMSEHAEVGAYGDRVRRRPAEEGLHQ